MGERDIILRRRAALTCAAMGGLMLSSPDALASDAPAEAAGDSAQAGPTLSEDELAATAETLVAEGRHEEALKVLFEIREPGLATMLRRGRLLLALGRHAHARTAYTLARRRATDPAQLREIDRHLEDLEDRTAEIVVVAGAGEEVMLDGESAGVTPLPVPLFVAPGAHEVWLKHAPEDKHQLDLAGGARVDLTLRGYGSQVCLSMMPPPAQDRSRLHWKIGAAPRNLINTTASSGTLLIGGALRSSLGVALGPFGFMAGPSASLFGSERGVAALGGAHMGADWAPVALVNLRLSTEVGYFHIGDDRDPLHEGRPAWLPVSSFYVQPALSVNVTVGPIEAGPRVGVMMSRAENGLVGEFTATYVSTALWITYVHVPER